MLFRGGASSGGTLPALSVVAAGILAGVLALRRPLWPVRLAGRFVEIAAPLAAPLVVPMLVRGVRRTR
jgi:hypothetical protein